ncbi:hereditary hemochromatosis protein homolog isoform X2 [Onychostoma macrolepis]|uniref:hereditary hemochromatosis protein homolog isoform X2 n=1 Tax=Onychostoma macrolepis TaxID=369639 RepID=UPI00272BBE6F|nr:hereditary hemochromatosis protein homolog isoform X2 [Onychostoma macrolepis]
MNTPCALMCFVLVPVSVSTGSHTLMGLATYITGEGAFSASVMLDDITVAYYNSETKIYVARGNDTNEDDVLKPNDLRSLSDIVLNFFIKRSYYLRPDNNTESENHVVHQAMGLFEQRDDKPVLITKTAYRSSSIDELRFIDGKFTYQGLSNYTEPEIKPNIELSKLLFKLNYQVCETTLKNYLKKRETQLNRKVKPQVRLIQKAISDSGGSHLSCLATGFYPRHINLTLFRDGQPVADHEITGGDLLPNDDGTYQMRKSLEISAADKHKYTCSATHLSLDNTLDVDLESEKSFKSAILSVLIVLALVLVFGTGAIIYKYRKA